MGWMCIEIRRVRCLEWVARSVTGLSLRIQHQHEVTVNVTAIMHVFVLSDEVGWIRTNVLDEN